MTVQPKFWILSLLILLGGINPSSAASPTVDPKILHIINRLSFGPRPGDIERVKSIGVDGYIKEQLSPDAIPEPQSLTSQISRLDTIRLNTVQISQYVRTQPKPSPEERKAVQKKVDKIFQEAVQARLLRATASPRQLQEVMVDFWYNHFNVYSDKGRDRYLVGAYEQEAIRPYALGRFRDLLGATAHHPAMLVYLDNFQNKVSNRPNVSGKLSGLNENYARELMELHTLGVKGGYTQQDVISLARILTGWGLSSPNQQTHGSSIFYFDSKHHDFSNKIFFGRSIQGSGEAEGEQALDILASSPATARHISYKLAEYFISDRPPTSLVNRLSEKFIATDGNIRDVLDTLFHSPEFWDANNFNSKFKTPLQYAISAVRATGVEVKNTRPISQILNQLGMPLYGYLTPDGYKNTEDTWLNPEAMNRRLNFATTIASGRLPLLEMPNNQDKNNQINQIQPLDASQLANTLGNFFSAKTESAIASSPPNLRAALILGSPEFMRR